MTVRTDGNWEQVFGATDALAHPVLVLDCEGTVLWCNQATEVLLGSSRKLLRHAAISAYLPEVPVWMRLLASQSAVSGQASQQTGAMDLIRPLIDPEPVHVTLSYYDAARRIFLLELTEIARAIRQAREQEQVALSDASRALLRNLAHEIKNPLGGIRGAAQLLELELTDREEREYTTVIIEETDRLRGLVDRFLTPYRREKIQLPVNIHEVLERVAKLVVAEFPVGLEIVRDYDVSVPEISGDSEQLVQVFLNLMRNATQAMREGISKGTARITLMTRVARHVSILGRRHRLALSVHVIDNGPGIEESIREKLFYPLVTGRKDGTGLGLSLVKTYIEQHGGSVEFMSEKGRTDFRILFPLSEAI